MLVFITLVSSYTKETLFDIINYLLKGLTENYSNTSPPKFLLNASPQKLNLYKWTILGLNIVIINAVNIFFIYYTQQKKLLKFYMIFIGSILIFGILFLFSGKLISPVFIEFSRTFQAIAESPLLLFALLLIYFFPDIYSK